MENVVDWLSYKKNMCPSCVTHGYSLQVSDNLGIYGKRSVHVGSVCQKGDSYDDSILQ